MYGKIDGLLILSYQSGMKFKIGNPLKKSNYKWRFISRVAAVANIILGIYHWPAFLEFGLLLIIQGALFWIVFDIVVNLTRNLEPLYIGNTNMLDKKFGRKVGWTSYLVIKLLLFISSLTIYILYTLNII